MNGLETKEQIDCANFNCIIDASKHPRIKLCSIVSYDLFQDGQDHTLQDPDLGLSYIVPMTAKSSNNVSTISAVLSVNPGQWTIAVKQKDDSYLLDPSGKDRILLLIQPGRLYLRSLQQQNTYLIADQSCKPQVIHMDAVSQQLKSLQGSAFQPRFNPLESEVLRRKVQTKAAKRKKLYKKLVSLLPELPD